MNSSENVHGENSAAQRTPVVHDVSPSRASPQCQPTRPMSARIAFILFTGPAKETLKMPHAHSAAAIYYDDLGQGEPALLFTPGCCANA
jgi:hypothetical protein